MEQIPVQQIIVTVDEQHLADIQGVATELQSVGMKVEEVMSTIGIICGEVAPTQLDSLSMIKGVLSVELDEPMEAI